VVDETLNILRPLAAMGQMDAALFDDKNPVAAEKLPQAWSEAIRLAGGNPAEVKNRVKYANYSWADANGDGLMQGNELQLAPGPLKQAPCLRVDQNLTLWTGRYQAHLFGLFQCYEPVRFTACGAPVWDLNAMKVGPKTARPMYTASLDVNPQGLTFLVTGGGGDGMEPRNTWDFATHGWGWPTTTRDAAGVLKLDGETAGNLSEDRFELKQ
jgi:hypothetical protein